MGQRVKLIQRKHSISPKNDVSRNTFPLWQSTWICQHRNRSSVCVYWWILYCCFLIMFSAVVSGLWITVLTMQLIIKFCILSLPILIVEQMECYHFIMNTLQGLMSHNGELGLHQNYCQSMEPNGFCDNICASLLWKHLSNKGSLHHFHSNLPDSLLTSKSILLWVAG